MGVLPVNARIHVAMCIVPKNKFALLLMLFASLNPIVLLSQDVLETFARAIPILLKVD